MVGWHHGLNGHEFQQALGDGAGQGSLERCHLWGHKELDMTEQLNNNSKLLPRKEVTFTEGLLSFFLLFLFFNFYFYSISLYNTVLVLPYIDMNPPRVYIRSQT